MTHIENARRVRADALKAGELYEANHTRNKSAGQHNFHAGIAPKLDPLIRRLASDSDGERLACLAAKLAKLQGIEAAERETLVHFISEGM
jgi:hypothetical protein